MRQQETFDEYAIDWAGPLPDEEYDGPPQSDDVLVEVPETTTSFTQQKFELLKAAIDPLQYSDNYGIEIYLTTVAFVERLMQE